jgi:hypothetical protein
MGYQAKMINKSRGIQGHSGKLKEDFVEWIIIFYFMKITLLLIEHILTGLIDPVESRAAGLFVYEMCWAILQDFVLQLLP